MDAEDARYIGSQKQIEQINKMIEDKVKDGGTYVDGFRFTVLSKVCAHFEDRGFKISKFDDGYCRSISWHK